MPSAAEVLARAKWRSSGISDDVAGKLNLKGLDAGETVALHHKFHPAATLHIPYFDFLGSPTGFYRLRYLEPLPGFAGQLEKPQRYTQAPGSLSEIYMPPLLKGGWAGVAQDPTISIYITEGELKAAAATARGYPTLGLGGVDSWRSQKRGLDFLPQLQEIKWQQREVFIIFDSDAAENPNVVNAQRRLAAELVARGARPRIVSLPSAEGAKVGLDDYLMIASDDDFNKLLDKSLPYLEGQALWELNEEVIYVRNPGLIVERESGLEISVKSFVTHTYANRHVIEQVNGASGRVTLKKTGLADKWIKWEHRFEVNKIIYEPGKPRLYEGNWNSWRGWGAEEKEGSVELWTILLNYAFRGEKEARKWFVQWCAYPVQYPGTKLYTSCLFWSSAHGTGKTLLAYLLKSIYGSNGIEINSDSLRSSFNSWAIGKQFVIGDEITAGDSRLDKDKLKWLVTRDYVHINQKYMPEYTIRDCINYIFTSNSPDALFIEDHDRRYFVQEVRGEPLPRRFYEECDQWLRHGNAAGNLLYHLRRVDLTGFNPRERAFETEAKRQMILTGKSDMGLFVAELREDPTPKLRVLGEEIATKCELFQPSTLLRCFDPEGVKRHTAAGMARELQRAGFRPLNGGIPVRTKLGTVRLYAIRNQDVWLTMAPKTIAEHYEKFFLDTQRF